MIPDIGDIPTTTWRTNDDPYHSRRRRAEALGWRYISNRSCPLILVGKRCLSRRPGTRFDCPCGTIRRGNDHPGYYRLNDHGATWRDEHGTRFILWEPYGADADDVADLAAAFKPYSITVDIIGSVYYPMRTVGIAFTADQPPRPGVRSPWISRP